jgi:hypothetical protein
MSGLWTGKRLSSSIVVYLRTVLLRIENLSEPTFYAGDPDIAALYSVISPALPAVPNPVLSPKDLDGLEGFFVAENFDSKKNFQLIFRITMSARWGQVNCLRACVTIAEIYKLLSGATISTLVLTRSLQLAKWTPPLRNYGLNEPKKHYWSIPA